MFQTNIFKKSQIIKKTYAKITYWPINQLRKCVTVF